MFDYSAVSETAAEREMATAESAPRLTSAALFKNAREILIEHRGQVYRLRLTGKGRLILTK